MFRVKDLKVFLFSLASERALRLFLAPMQYIIFAISSEVKKREREAEQSLPSSTKLEIL
jgi:hypothetical protein